MVGDTETEFVTVAVVDIKGDSLGDGDSDPFAVRLTVMVIDTDATADQLLLALAEVVAEGDNVVVVETELLTVPETDSEFEGDGEVEYELDSVPDMEPDADTVADTEKELLLDGETV
jgi:hypothetical protein